MNRAIMAERRETGLRIKLGLGNISIVELRRDDAKPWGRGWRRWLAVAVANLFVTCLRIRPAAASAQGRPADTATRRRSGETGYLSVPHGVSLANVS